LFDPHIGEPDPLTKFCNGKTLAPLNFPKNGELRVVVAFGK